MHWTGAAILAGTLASLASPAAAREPTEQEQVCANQDHKHTREDQMAACSAVIEANAQGDSDVLAWAHYERAYIRVDRGELDDAIADWSESIRINPKDVDSYVNRGTAYHRQSKFALAIADYDQALALQPNQADVYTDRGNSYRRLGKSAAALADLNRAIELDPKYSQAYLYRGNTYSDRRDFAHAIADYSSAIGLNASYALAYYGRGMAERKSGKPQAAAADIAKAKSIDPHVGD